MFRLALLAAAASGLTPAASAGQGAQAGGDGVYPDSIVFGQSAALSGPAAELGRNMNLGIRAAFEEANRSGGIHGRQLKLLVRDDGYEPEAAVANTRELIAQRRLRPHRRRRHPDLQRRRADRQRRLGPLHRPPSPAPSCSGGRTSATWSTCAPPTTRRPRRWWSG